MATGVKEVHLQEKCISVLSTPRRVLLSHGTQTTADSPNGDIPMAKEKPTPNYLKPTISSCHDTSCRYPKSQQQKNDEEYSTAAAGAKKRFVSVKSMEKPTSPPSPGKTPKGRTTRTDLWRKTALSLKINVPEKASESPTSGAKISLQKSTTKSRGEANGAIKPEQKEKVLFIDIGVQSQAARHGSQSPKRDAQGKRCKSSEESDTGRQRTPTRKASKKVFGNERAPKKLKVQRGRERDGDEKEAMNGRLKPKQSRKRGEVAGEGKTEQESVVLKRQEVKGKDAPPDYNDVIEETAARLATRRSKVKALVGAFECVISLQGPEETPPSQRQEVAAARVGKAGQPAKDVKIGEGAERGEPGLDSEERSGRSQRQQTEEKGRKAEKESGEEESKGGCQLGQESQQKVTKGEEEGGGEEPNASQLGQESRQKETEATKSDGDADDGLAEEDGNNATKELTESLKWAEERVSRNNVGPLDL